MVVIEECMGNYDRRGLRPDPQPPCPGCREPMETYQRRGLELERCNSCRGVWFDALELAAAARCALPPVTSVEPSERRCPACETAMERRAMGTVTVDGCRTCHGVFLDWGEYGLLRRGRLPVRGPARSYAEGEDELLGVGALGILGALVSGIGEL